MIGRDKPYIHLHPPTLSTNAKDTKYPDRIPKTINASLSEIKSPLRFEGAVSDIYPGAPCIAKPIPSPYTRRPMQRGTYPPAVVMTDVLYLRDRF